MVNKDPRVKLALISVGGAIAVALITAILNPSWWRSDKPSPPIINQIIAGRVVDEVTNLGIGQASISIVGRSETDISEDNGNFRIDLQAPIPKSGTVRIHVLKAGYIPRDETTTPTESLVVQLRQM